MSSLQVKLWYKSDIVNKPPDDIDSLKNICGIRSFYRREYSCQLAFNELFTRMEQSFAVQDDGWFFFRCCYLLTAACRCLRIHTIPAYA